MTSRYTEFECNVCGDAGVMWNVVQIAETPEEFERLRKAFIPPYAEFSNNDLVKQFPCTNKSCTGYINVKLGETSY